jgi:hypothetical protein
MYLNLSDAESKELKKLAATSFFSKKRNYKLIFKTLDRLKKLKTENLNKEKVTDNLINESKLTKRTLWNRLSELTKITEYYHIIKHIEKNDKLKSKILLETLGERKEYKTFNYQINLAFKIISDSKLRNDSFSDYQQMIYLISRFYSENNNYEEFTKLYRDHSEYYTADMLMQVFRMQLDFLLQKKNNSIYTPVLLNEVMKNLNYESLLMKLKDELPHLYPPVELYYNLYKSFSNPGQQSYYHRAKEILITNSGHFEGGFKNEIYQHLRNYCIDKTNAGNSEYYREIFELNNLILKEGLFKDLNVVNSQTNNFRNFIFAASRLKEYKWIKNFINDYSKELPESIREDEVNLSNAILSIDEENFSAASEYLNKVKRKSYLHYLDTSIYKLIVFYETNDIEGCYTEIARLKDYLRQHKEIPVYLKNSYQRFIKKFESLLKINEKSKTEEIEIFINQMQELKNIGMGSWFLQKAEELMQALTPH